MLALKFSRAERMLRLFVTFTCCSFLGLAEGSPLYYRPKIADLPGDESSGCPSFGCLPSGTFSLSSDIPGNKNQTVVIKWTTLLTNRTTSSAKRSLQGCVTCQSGVVCPTHSGYVSVDQLKGNIVWRYEKLTSPTTPVLDIYGDAIGTDGKSLVEVESDGKPQKPIKLTGHLAPMYSIELTNNDLMLMSSRADGLLITYGTDGIIEASIILQGSVERANGTFIPVAQPVIYGMRAYILTEFVPDSPSLQGEGLGLQRLYAVDLWRRMVKRISPVWYFNFERMTTCHSGRRPVSPVANSVLVHNDTIYVSLGHPEVGCSPARSSHDNTRAARDDQGTLWGFRDNGTAPELLFKVEAPVSSLSLFDVSIGERHVQGWRTGKTGFPQRRPARDTSQPLGGKRASTDNNTNNNNNNTAPILWAATSSQLNGYNSLNGSIQYVINVRQLLNVTCQITSKVMVTRDKGGTSERLVFAVSDSERWFHSDRFENGTKSHIVAVNVGGESKQPQLLWKVAVMPGTRVVGQIANVLVVPPYRADSRRRVPRSASHQGNYDDVEVLLVATAFSDTAEYVFAIGQA